MESEEDEALLSIRKSDAAFHLQLCLGSGDGWGAAPLISGERARGDGGVSGGPPPPVGALRFSDVLQNFSGS